MNLAALDPINNPAAWNVVNVAGTDTPGYCELHGFEREQKVDKKGGKGTAGATSTLVELPPATGTLKIFVWTPEHFAALDTLLPLFFCDPSVGKSLKPVDIYYPSLAANGVKSVVAEKIGLVTHEGSGMYSVTIELSEYRPPAKANATSTASGSSAQATPGGGGKAPPGTTPDPEIDQLQKEAAKLADEAAKAYQ